jgi:hypothetical protein
MITCQNLSATKFFDNPLIWCNEYLEPISKLAWPAGDAPKWQHAEEVIRRILPTDNQSFEGVQSGE